MKRMYNKTINFLDNILEKVVNFTNQGGSKIEKIMISISKLTVKKLLLLGVMAFFVLGGFLIIWASTFSLPTLDNFEERQIVQSTKIYDRTGDVILFDVHGEVTRTVVPLEEINDYVKWATIAIEDSNFYNHNGIEPKAILRAILVNLKDGDLFGGQGGSTITQQVIKNALLTSDKKISRKLKEWVLAPKLESIMGKDEILEVYLNEVPYGGTVYGVQEASRRFYSKDAKDLTLVESAYLAALPQAPTYFSPYGNNRDRLDIRKDKVLQEMVDNGFISQEEFDDAKKEVIEFQKPENFGIKAPHFVMYIRALLEEEYGVEAVEKGGLKVITTLDWDIQEKGEEIVKKHALANSEKFDAENGSIVAIDPKTGQILTMVGSRDYFDEDIDGNFNIATAERQPGSAFKPFVYAEAFNKGYRPETVVFDLSTEFSTVCASGGNCYNPVNYDGVFKGPISLRDALAQSVNVPAVKVLYLTGIRDSLDLAKKLGLETLTNIDQYGLTLVLGGGEVRPIDMAGAYGVFATGGVKHEVTGILRIEDKNGEILEEFEENKGNRVLPEQTAYQISDVLSDNVARTPAFGSNSYLHFGDRDVAAKTGTTNDYRDAWIVGYTPKISVAAWAGNNDNRSMDKKVAGFIVAPMWNEFMQAAFLKEEYSGESFPDPEPLETNVKGIIAGFWKGENIEIVDTEDGKKVITTESGEGIHSILHYVNKSNPLGAVPSNPSSDPQYNMWEESVQKWLGVQNIQPFSGSSENTTSFKIINPENGFEYFGDQELLIAIDARGIELSNGTVFLNGTEVGEINTSNNSLSITPNEQDSIKDSNVIKVISTDSLGNTYEDTVTFRIK